MSPVSRQPKRFWSIVVLAAIVAAIGFWAGQNHLSWANLSPATSQSPTASAAVTPQIITGSVSPSPTLPASHDLILLDQVKAAHEIIEFNPVTKKKTVLFTDQDEPVKIKQVANLAADANEVLAVVGDPNSDLGGSLWAIALDGSGKTTPLIEHFSSPWPPAVSPDGSQIAYVYFSNAETDAGYHLVLADRDGSNARSLVKASTAITQPVFGSDGQSITYAQDTTALGAMIVRVAVGTDKKTTLASFSDHVPYDLAVATNGDTAFIDGTGAQARLYESVNGQPDPIKLTIPSGHPSHPVYDPQANSLAFTATGTETSQIYTYNLKTQTYQALTTGLLAIGWR